MLHTSTRIGTHDVRPMDAARTAELFSALPVSGYRWNEQPKPVGSTP